MALCNLCINTLFLIIFFKFSSDVAQEAKTNFLHSVSSVGSAPQLAAICCAGVTPAYTSLSSGLFLFGLVWVFSPLKTHLYIAFMLSLT